MPLDNIKFCKQSVLVEKHDKDSRIYMPKFLTLLMNGHLQYTSFYRSESLDLWKI